MLQCYLWIITTCSNSSKKRWLLCTSYFCSQCYKLDVKAGLPDESKSMLLFYDFDMIDGSIILCWMQFCIIFQNMMFFHAILRKTKCKFQFSQPYTCELAWNMYFSSLILKLLDFKLIQWSSYDVRNDSYKGYHYFVDNYFSFNYLKGEINHKVVVNVWIYAYSKLYSISHIRCLYDLKKMWNAIDISKPVFWAYV